MSAPREQYASGSYHNQVMHQRTAESHAAFFLTHLRPGMRLLDCGCGPGSITVGLAEVVAPADVVGIDLGQADIEKATDLALERNVPNARFQVASVYEIPFENETFDAVFAQGLLEHLAEPAKALIEMRRVLKPGGIIGVRSPDYGGHIYSPQDALIDESLALIERVVIDRGGSRRLGRHFRAMLREAGFANVEGSASYECNGTPESTRREGEAMAAIFSETGFRQQITEMGWADEARLNEMASAWLSWGEQPDAFRASPWCEAVGWKQV